MKKSTIITIITIIALLIITAVVYKNHANIFSVANPNNYAYFINTESNFNPETQSIEVITQVIGTRDYGAEAIFLVYIDDELRSVWTTYADDRRMTSQTNSYPIKSFEDGIHKATIYYKSARSTGEGTISADCLDNDGQTSNPEVRIRDWQNTYLEEIGFKRTEQYYPRCVLLTSLKNGNRYDKEEMQITDVYATKTNDPTGYAEQTMYEVINKEATLINYQKATTHFLVTNKKTITGNEETTITTPNLWQRLIAWLEKIASW